MDERSRLKLILDEMDEEELFAAEIYLMNIVGQRTPSIRSEKNLAELDQRTEAFRRQVQQHWRDAAAKIGTSHVGGMGGGGGTGFDFRGLATGKTSFTYSEGEAEVEESLRFVAGYEIVTVDRFGLSGDGKNLLYEQVVRSSGREVAREEVFPCAIDSRWVQD